MLDRQPIANTLVQVLIDSDGNSSQRTRKALTDKAGRYSIEVLPGHGWAWFTVPPPGYSLVEENVPEHFATTKERPVFTKNYRVSRGISVGVALAFADKPIQRGKTQVFLSQSSGREAVLGYCDLDESGAGTVTLPQLKGRFEVACADEKRSLVTPDSMAVDFDEGFDPHNVLPDVRRQGDGTILVKDALGHTAKLTNCTA